MQTPEEFASDYLRANSFYTQEYSYQVLRDDDGYELSLLIAARDAEIRRECADRGEYAVHVELGKIFGFVNRKKIQDIVRAAIIGEEE